MPNYDSLSDKSKAEIIDKLYSKDNLSFKDIATQHNTYPNKVLRDAKRLGIPIKNKSEAQKNALKTGRHQHPTKGRERSDEEKHNIGSGVMKNWQNMSPDELRQKQAMYLELWNKKTEDEKANMLHKANIAVRHSSKVGSKLEHFILKFLVGSGIKTEFHKEQMLVNTKLQVDIFLPTMNIAIEIDGPSHFEPVWGEDILNKNIAYDKKKTGLLIGKGYKLIRIKQTKDFSKTRAKMVCDKLNSALLTIKNDTTINVIEIGDTDG
jgi:very-short-patch-repair endonuclease